jgi:hypothetical protein
MDFAVTAPGLRAKRERRRWTRDRLAKETGIPASRLWEIEVEVTPVEQSDRTALIRALDAEWSELFMPGDEERGRSPLRPRPAPQLA